MPSNDDFVSEAFKGTTKGFLEWTFDRVSSLVKKFKEKKLAFIKEPTTIEVVREQYRSGEGKFYQRYVKDKDLLFLIRMGLTMRKIEDDDERYTNLREKIHSKFKVEGLHIAEFVQNRLLNRYVGILIDELESLGKLGKEIEEVLKEIDKHVLFVKTFEKPSDVITKTLTIITSHSPRIFVVSGKGPATEIVNVCEKKLISALKNYEVEFIKERKTENLFFKKL